MDNNTARYFRLLSLAASQIGKKNPPVADSDKPQPPTAEEILDLLAELFEFREEFLYEVVLRTALDALKRGNVGLSMRLVLALMDHWEKQPCSGLE